MFADCTFADFHGDQDVVYIYTAATMSMVNCTFTNNAIVHSEFFATAMIWARSEDLFDRNTTVRLQGCTFTGNTPHALAPHDVAADNTATGEHSAVFYSDSTSMSVCTFQGDDEIPPEDLPPCIESKPLALSESENENFLPSATPWLQEVQRVRLFPIHE